MEKEQVPVEATLRRRRIFFALTACFLIILLLILGFLYSGTIAREFDFLARIQASKVRFREWIDSFGAWSPLVFMGVQVLQVVVSPIPGELTGFLGGYVFGAWLATFYGTIGLSIGTCICFFLGRWLGRPFVERLISRKILEKFDFLVSHKGALLALILYVIPGFPKDYMSYLLGLSPLRARVFVLVSTVGRIPGTFLLGLQGANLYEERYGALLTIFVIILAAGLGFTYAREPIRLWFLRRAKANQETGEGV